jgi:hypothetical protein
MVLIVYRLRYVLTFSFASCDTLPCFGFSKLLYSLQAVAKMRDMVNSDSQNPVSNSFLLDDDLRSVIPRKPNFSSCTYLCLDCLHDSCTVY